MATGFYTSSTLIDSVKRRASIPISQNTFSNADLLAFANEEIDLGVLPAILQYHEEYYVYSSTIPLVANQAAYNIPYRAVGGRVRDVMYQDSSGNLREMTRIFPDDRAFYQQSNSNGPFLEFYVQGHDIVIQPAPTSASGSLIVTYYLKPNSLVDESRVATVTAINTNTGVITVDAVPSVITAGSDIDFLEAKPGFRTRSLDINVSSVDAAASTITVAAADIPSTLVVGDNIALANECAIPQIPLSFHVLLAQRVAARCLEALGDQQGLTAANAKLIEMETKMATLVDNRVEGAPQKAINRNGFLRSNAYRRRF